MILFTVSKLLKCLPDVSRVKRPLVLRVDLLEELVEAQDAAHNVATQLPGYEPGHTVGLSQCQVESLQLN